MKYLLIYLLACILLNVQGQTTASVNAKTTLPAVQHFSVVLPLYEVIYKNKVLQTDPQVIWMDTAVAVGDTLKLSDKNLRLDKATLSFTFKEEVTELELHGNVITKKFKNLLQSAYTEKGALLFLDLNTCVDKQGKPVKNECSYRLKFY